MTRAADGDTEGLARCFGDGVTFGTAGLRAPMGPGPSSMNAVVVRAASVALRSELPVGATVVVGHDGRHRSAGLASAAAGALAAGGARPVLLEGPLPTPLVAFAVRHLDAAAGVVITASHNPASDNGYKVYLADGIQIGPPVEQRVAAVLAPLLARLADGDPNSLPAVAEVVPDGRATAALVDAYLAAVTGRLPAGPRDVVVAYTALHGVGQSLLLRAFSVAGFPVPATVAAQGTPDGDFPTVSFPNPEEPGALDLLEERARQTGADVGLANDPDADRLGVIVARRGSWEKLSGDEIGVLLADHLLDQGEGEDRLVVRTIVSSRLLDAVARAHGVTSAATLTGFKHVMAAARDRPELRFVLGYEEALGFALGDAVRDKDGIAAALVMADLVARLKVGGETLDDRLDDLARRHGLHRARSRSVRFDGLDGGRRRGDAMVALRADPPEELAGRPVRALTDHLRAIPPTPVADVVVLELDAGAWVAVRPSGTEPKLKVYAEVVERVAGDASVDDARARADEALTELHRAVSVALGLAG